MSGDYMKSVLNIVGVDSLKSDKIRYMNTGGRWVLYRKSISSTC